VWGGLAMAGPSVVLSKTEGKGKGAVRFMTVPRINDHPFYKAGWRL